VRAPDPRLPQRRRGLCGQGRGRRAERRWPRRPGGTGLDFFAKQVHELRNPLAVITVLSAFVLEQLQERGIEDLTQDVADRVTAADRLRALVNRTLDLSKIEAGRMSVLLEPVDDPMGPRVRVSVSDSGIGMSSEEAGDDEWHGRGLQHPRRGHDLHRGPARGDGPPQREQLRGLRLSRLAGRRW
jgi:hypothetical protein